METSNVARARMIARFTAISLGSVVWSAAALAQGAAGANTNATAATNAGAANTNAANRNAANSTAATTSTAAGRGGPTDPGVRGGDPGAGGPLQGLGDVEQQFFQASKQVFEEVDAVPEGLGPRFNLDSCAGCHAHPT